MYKRQADILPPLVPDAILPPTQVIDDFEKSYELVGTLKELAQGPIILLPVFTRCKGACPALAQGLRSATRELTELMKDVKVVVYTFDPEDVGKSLQEFRSAQQLPNEWLMIRSDSENSKRFFDALQYSYLDQDGDFIHPNQFFVFNKNLEWKGLVVGTDFKPSQLQDVLELARGSMGIIETSFKFPEPLAVIAGILFMALTLALFFYKTLRA